MASGDIGTEVSRGEYDYNYAGMRIRHLGSERGDIEYIYDDQSIVDEVLNSSTTQVAHYRYGDRLLSLATDAGEQFYHYASLGTTANLSNSSGENQIAYRVDPFGDITHQEGESENRQVFTGQEHDEQTGLIYFGARFYDPDSARFINQDSYLGESNTPPSLHRYLYAYSNPNYYTDPDGHTAIGSAAANNVNAAAQHFDQVAEDSYGGNSASDWLGMGLTKLGSGFLKGTAFAMNTVDHGINLTSMATGGFGNDDWAMAHAQEITETNAKVNGIVNQLRDPNDHRIADGFFSTAEGILSGNKKSIGTGLEAVGALFTGKGLSINSSSKGLPSLKAVKNAQAKSLESFKKGLTRESALTNGGAPLAGLARSAASGAKEGVKAVVQASREIKQHIADVAAMPRATGWQRQIGAINPDGVRLNRNASTNKQLLENELTVDTFGKLTPGKVGDNLTPHHMPSDKYVKNVLGGKRSDGISMMMEQPSPGVGGRHRRTRTYGGGGRNPSLTDEIPREALGRDIRDARSIYQQDGLYTPEVRGALQEVIRQNKRQWPGAFDK